MPPARPDCRNVAPLIPALAHNIIATSGACNPPGGNCWRVRSAWPAVLRAEQVALTRIAVAAAAARLRRRRGSLRGRGGRAFRHYRDMAVGELDVEPHARAHHGCLP